MCKKEWDYAICMYMHRYVCGEGQKGSLNAEHGLGRQKSRYLTWQRSPQFVQLMRLTKRAFDPRCTLNPHKVFPAEHYKEVHSPSDSSTDWLTEDCRTSATHWRWRWRRRSTDIYIFLWTSTFLMHTFLSLFLYNAFFMCKLCFI